MWIPAEKTDKARLMGYTVVDPANVVATHLTELIRTHAHELLTRQDADAFMDRVKDEHPKLIEDLVPKLMPLSLVQRVLQNLLRERASIRDSLTILEGLAEAGTATKNPTLLTEFIRQALSRSLVRPYMNDKAEMPAYLLDPVIEQSIQSGIEHNETSSRLNLAPETLRDLLERIKRGRRDAAGAHGAAFAPPECASRFGKSSRPKLRCWRCFRTRRFPRTHKWFRWGR